MIMINYDEIENLIGYKFENKDLLLRAFTHSSFSKSCNERLEFLGDSVLQVIVSNYLYNESSYDEGVLSKYRAKIVCENNLFNAINKLNLQKYLIVGDSFKGEPSKAMCADLCESIIGAIYLDSGAIESARKFIFKFVDLNLKVIEDYKSMLQELVQGKGEDSRVIEYDTKQVGDNVNILFETTVLILGQPYGKGQGRTKKDAEQNSAKVAIEKFKLGE